MSDASQFRARRGTKIRLKADLHTCGLDLDKLSELPANLEKLINVKLEITKRARGENENVYINRRIVLEDGGDECDSAARRTTCHQPCGRSSGRRLKRRGKNRIA